MQFTKYAIAAGICCVLSLGAVAASPYFLDAPKVEVTSAGVIGTTADTVEEALQRVDFPVKQAESLPFGVAQTSAFTRELPGGVQTIEITYSASGAEVAGHTSPMYISVTTINKPGVVQDISSYPITTLSLKNGHTAYYLNNETTQILSWSDQHQSYSIFAGKPDGIFTADDLATIANSLR
jgi:hypothetical protein